MSAIVGKYDFDNWENIEEYLTGLGVGFVLRRVRQAAKPTLDITYYPDIDEWSITTESAFNTHSLKFRLGQSVEDKTYDARNCTTIGQIVDDKIILEQKCDEGPDVQVIVEKIEEELVKITQTAGNLSSSIYFRKQG